MKEFGMVLLGFLSGAVMYSYWLPKVVFKVDVREGTTDQNPGGYNAFMLHRTLGLICILLDMLKGLIPVYFFVKKIGMDSPWICPMLLAPVLGHAFTPLFKGKGGKALSTAAGTFLGLLPTNGMGVLLLVIALLLSVVIKINPFEMRVAAIMISFNLLIILFKWTNVWISIASWSITGILWHKQMEKKLEDRPFTCTPFWRKAC